MQRLDAHIHLWRFDAEQFAWLDPATSSAIRRDFLLDDLAQALASANVDAAIAVQACQTVAETEWLLQCASETDQIHGVVGWIPLMDEALPAILEALAVHPKLVGFREIVQSQPARFLDQPGFHRGIAELTRYDLAYDILIREHQLAEATRFVDRHPKQRFILNHAAKPRIAAAELEPWASYVRDLARRENVSCKLSGLVTEADWLTWTPASLRPYLDVCAESFGPKRLLAASDWPVCLLASSYERWWALLDDYFTFSEKEHVFAGNARRVYSRQSAGPIRL